MTPTEEQFAVAPRLKVDRDNFLAAVGEASLFQVDDSPLLSSYAVYPKPELLTFTWELEGVSYEVNFDEESLSDVRAGEDDVLWLRDWDGVLSSLHLHKLLSFNPFELCAPG